MRHRFPGMDPWLEHPSLWPDVHNRLIAAIADDLAPRIAPRYYVGLERRAYLLRPDDVAFIGRPDLAVIPARPARPVRAEPPDEAAVAVLDVDVPMEDEVEESYLEVHEVATGRLVTVLELLSPVNKVSADGRRQYLDKRSSVTRTRTNLVEVDLLRAGEPMFVVTARPWGSDYRILVSRGVQRPRAKLYVFNVRDPIPTVPIPLLPGDDEPALALGPILHALYDRARFDLRLDYHQPPVPPLADADAGWAREVVGPA